MRGGEGFKQTPLPTPGSATDITEETKTALESFGWSSRLKQNKNWKFMFRSHYTYKSEWTA